MANNRVYQLPVNFSMDGLVAHLGNYFTSLGYSYTPAIMGEVTTIHMEKNVGGIHWITGLGQQADVTINVFQGGVNVTVGGEYWTDKIIAYVLGGFTCGITLVTAIIGTINQVQLPNKVQEQINVFMMGGGAPQQPYGMPPQQPYNGGQAPYGGQPYQQ